jgi:hypothetical protein
VPCAPLLAQTPAVAGLPGKTLAAKAVAKVEGLENRREAVTLQAPAPASADAGTKKPFFRSGKGMLVLGLMAVGTGFAIYTATSERIDNPVR